MDHDRGKRGGRVKALDALNILTAPQCAVVREGREKRVDVSSLVRDDIVLFSTGEQVCADAVVVDGTCLVNEALVTGEADEIRKAPGDTLLSGSFLVSGMCRARLTAVGADSFVSRLTLDAKAQKKRQAAVLDLVLGGVDLAVAGNHAAGQLGITGAQGGHCAFNCAACGMAHAGQHRVQCHQLGIIHFA